MTRMKQWVKLPTQWIEDGGLLDLRWEMDVGSKNIAGLMVYAVIAHNADDVGTIERLTYDDFSEVTGLSRTMISNGLERLYEMKLVEKDGERQSKYHLLGFNPEKGWGKLPARGLYQRKRIPAFHEMYLRKKTELDAFKLYYAVVARRDNAANVARMSYVTIEEYVGIPRNRIRSAISLLAANNMLHVDHRPSRESEYGVSNAYRLAHLETHKHRGTTGRSDIGDRVFTG